MTHLPTRRFGRLWGALILLLGLAQAAAAHNVPGSAQTTLPQLTEIATGMIVESIKDDMRAMRAGDGSVQVSNNGFGPAFGLAATTGGGTPLAFSLTHRRIDTDRAEGGLTTGSLLLGRNLDGGLLLFGGLVAETADIRTRLDAGRIQNDGLGLALGADVLLGERLFLTAIIGAMNLDYDVVRGAGAITGAFGARRRFIDLSADYVDPLPDGEFRAGLGLLHVSQRNDGYTESGGAVVAPFSARQLIGRLELRRMWGAPGQMRPYLDLTAQGRFGGSTSLIAAPGGAVTDDWRARLALGGMHMGAGSQFDASLGANFGGGAFSGLDLRLRYNLRF